MGCCQYDRTLPKDKERGRETQSEKVIEIEEATVLSAHNAIYNSMIR